MYLLWTLLKDLLLVYSYFSLNNSETVKFVTLAFCNIQWHFIIDIHAKCGIPNSPKSPNIGQNSEGGICDFRISDQSLIKENCYNSRTSDDIDIKPGSVTKLDRRNKIISKFFKMTSCWKIITSFSFFQYTANLDQSGSRIPNAWSVKLTSSLAVTFYLTKTENRTKKSRTQFSHYYFN